MRPVKQEEPTSDEDVEEQGDADDNGDDDNLDTSCGFGVCRKIEFFNKYLANKNTFIFVYGVLGCIYGSTYAYSNSTLSTIEKRYKIPSKVTGRK
jgi:Organic Anion Transporter Polypeptide (OATP) family